MASPSGWAGVTVPKLRPKAICCSGVMSWSQKNTTRHCSRAWRISLTVSSSRGRLRSTPWISAPITAVSGRTSRAISLVVVVMGFLLSPEESADERLAAKAVGTDGEIPREGHPLEAALDLTGVQDVHGGEVGGGPVVPEGDAARPPTKPDGVLVAAELLVEDAQDGVALPFAEADDIPGEMRVDEDGLLARFGVDPHDRVHGAQHRLGHRVFLGDDAEPPGMPLVHGVEPVDGGLYGRGEALVGGHQIGPLRVAGVVGDDLGPEDRPPGRVGDEGEVGVPPVGGVVVFSSGVGRVARIDTPQLGGPPPAPAGVEGQELRVFFAFTADRVPGVELADRPPEGDLLLAGDGLVAEEHDSPAQQRLTDLGHRLRLERLAQVHPIDLGADDGAQRADLQLFGDGGWARGGHAATTWATGV